ncbi:MAG: methylenetetrahydrofolate reductase C-terminal domain-containing protein [Candidatus Altiarchaeota archaeon]
MIRLRLRDLEELKKKGKGKKLLVTCNLCVNLNRYLRSEKQRAIETEKFNKIHKGLGIAGEWVGHQICLRDPKEMKGLKETIKDYDTVYVYAEGPGVQVVSEECGIAAIPIADTTSTGAKTESGIKDYCMLCGDCTVDETAGLCVKTRCPKGLLNGPCAGVEDGKCEVPDDNGEKNMDCIWVTVFQRMKKMDKLDDFIKTRMPKLSGSK